MTRVLVTRVAVTRAAAQSRELADLLREAGFEPVVVPVIAIEDPADGGAALRAAADRLHEYDWIVLTSVNGARRLLDAATPPWPPNVAAIGPGTAGVLTGAGIKVALLPKRFVAESLLEAFPAGPGRVLLARAAVARDVLPDGLRRTGWIVDVVDAYRTTAPPVSADQRNEVRRCDAITFTSPSTVQNFVTLFGRDLLPPRVVSIGPVTSAACAELDIPVTAEANPHTMPGVVAALKALDS